LIIIFCLGLNKELRGVAVCPCLGDRRKGLERKNVAQGWTFFLTRLYANVFIGTSRDNVVSLGIKQGDEMEMRFKAQGIETGVGVSCSDLSIIKCFEQ
jgi:hypothetical protein